MGKLHEKVVTNRLSKAAEDSNLLLGEQMRALPRRFRILAIELLTEQSHNIWEKDKN